VSAIEITGLRVRRGGNLVLPDLSLNVENGSVTGLLGPSGCGKTTLMRSIVGVQIVQAVRSGCLVTRRGRRRCGRVLPM
jgi:ABC-2 type transport system ATP-binding protein